jgi:hypothetical protein
MVIPPAFQGASPFAANGLAAVRVSQEKEVECPGGMSKKTPAGTQRIQEEKKCHATSSGIGFINAKGEMVIPPDFKQAWPFAANGLARVESQDGKYGFINANGKMVIPAVFKDAQDFSANGLAVVKTDNEKQYYINSQGEIAIQESFFAIHGFSANGLALVFGDFRASGYQTKRYIDAQGKIQLNVPRDIDWASDFSANGLARIAANGKTGYMNARGEQVIPLRWFEETNDFNANGLAWVKENGKKGYMNAQGEIVVYVDNICATDVLKNSHDQIIWPRKTADQICQGQPK